MTRDAPGRGIRVLQVDDEENQLEFTRLFLREFDRSIEVESSDSPIGALEMACKDPYDCIVLDYNMPVMNGLAFARKLRSKTDVPLLLYTCWSNEEVRWGEDAGLVDDYVQKEVDPGHYTLLAHRIRHLACGARLHGHGGGMSNPEAVVITEGYAIVYASPGIQGLMGEAASQVKGRSLLDWIPEAERGRFQRAVEAQPPREEGSVRLTVRNSYGGAERVQTGFVKAAYAGREVTMFFLPLPRVSAAPLVSRT